MIFRVGPLDILFGKGGRVNLHDGNKTYLRIVAMEKKRYLEAKPAEKKVIALQVIDHLKTKGFRFLKCDNTGWIEATPAEIRKKVTQALREGMAKIHLSDDVADHTIDVLLNEDTSLFEIGDVVGDALLNEDIGLFEVGDVVGDVLIQEDIGFFEVGDVIGVKGL